MWEKAWAVEKKREHPSIYLQSAAVDWNAELLSTISEENTTNPTLLKTVKWKNQDKEEHEQDLKY